MGKISDLFRWSSLIFCFLMVSFLPLHGGGGSAYADGCDPLADEEVGYPPTTDWEWITDACPPPPSADASPSFNGVGVTLYGGVTVPTRNDLFGVSVRPGIASINSLVRNGYEGGLSVNSWINQDIGFRVILGIEDFPGQIGGKSFQAGEVTLGTVLKLLGSQTIFLYLAMDGGGALSGLDVSNAFSGTAPSAYLDVGLGLNISFVAVEIDYVTLFTPGGLPNGGNPFFFVPLTIGLHL
ncbi:MAG: hypothetical protein ACYCT9_06620 [Leptospirillum sp.]